MRITNIDARCAISYNLSMIKSLKHKGLRNFYLSGDSSGIISEHKRRLQIILQLLDAATSPEKLNLPGFGFHKLKGDLNGYYSVRVRANWRIIFQFENKNAILINYLDYH